MDGKRALAARQFREAKVIYAGFLHQHPDDVAGRLGLADAELGLREFEAAELDYRRVAAAQPLLWAAHKNLVIVEAALGRWEEFDREREVLRAARERGAAGLSTHESDVIETMAVRPRGSAAAQSWIVRSYYEPAGRSQALYNFERFSASGRVQAYVSLESADAFEREAPEGAVLVGPPTKAAADGALALNWYDGKSHGVIATYAREPAYEVVRAAFLKWARQP